MTLTVIAAAALLLALLPALLLLSNLRQYRPAPPAEATPADRSAVSVLIPARNEVRAIGPAVQAALANTGVSLEVIVLDDQSDDGTGQVVAQLAATDPRVRLIPGRPLPPGWCGKQYACALLAETARHPLLLFVDADVRLAPDALPRMVAFLEQSGADLVSGVPRQETGTLAEKLVIPLIHFVLLGFLPLGRMRQSRQPGYGAGCGQLFLARRTAYDRAGGHAALRDSLHDGVKLPRAFRAAGLRTDLFDATDVAVCRMYRGPRELWWGLAKNAHEGLAAPAMIGPATLLLFGGQVVPFLLLAFWPFLPLAAGVLGLHGTAAALLPRLVAARRFRQPVLGALLHPAGISVLLAIQWFAFARRLLGRPLLWKDRRYPALSATSNYTLGGRT